MSEGHLPLDGTPDALEPLPSDISATQKTAAVCGGRHRRLATLGGAFLALIGLVGYFYWSMVHDEHTTAQIQKELKAEGVQLFFSKAEPKEASFSPFQQLTSTVKVMAPAGNVTDILLKRIAGINLDMDLVLNNCPVTDDGLAALSQLEFPYLGTLTIEHLPNVTDKGIQQLAGFQSLEFLTVTGTKVTRKGAEQLRNKIPGLTVLGLP